MKRSLALFVFLFLVACASQGEVCEQRDYQKDIFKGWVLSRCLSYTLQAGDQRQDALNTAGVFLEKSTLSVEQLMSSEPLIKKYLLRNYQGSVSGTFNILKCIDLFGSQELDEMYSGFKHE